MSDPDRLTPGEHDRMRAQLLAGADADSAGGRAPRAAVRRGRRLLVGGAVAGGVVWSRFSGLPTSAD